MVSPWRVIAPVTGQLADRYDQGQPKVHAPLLVGVVSIKKVQRLRYEIAPLSVVRDEARSHSLLTDLGL
jgi:hypothetical protein